MKSPQEDRALHDPKDTDLIQSKVEVKDLSTDTEPRGVYDGDEDQLARLGKKQVLKVRDLDQGYCGHHANSHSVTLDSGQCWALAVFW